MADEPKPRLDQIDFRFETDPNYRIVPVNGIWGGPTLRGDIRVDLFYERQALPEHVGNRVASDGMLGEELGRSEPQNLFVRTLMVGIMLNPDQADSIGQWLMTQAAIVRGLKSDKAEEKAQGKQEQESKADESVH